VSRKRRTQVSRERSSDPGWWLCSQPRLTRPDWSKLEGREKLLQGDEIDRNLM